MPVIEQIITEVPQSFHDSGSLSKNALRGIAKYHRRAGARVSAETGCGLSTLVLSNLSEKHTSFTISLGNSLANTQSHPSFSQDHVEFVIGPTQTTLRNRQLDGMLDFVLIDGPHAYPFPEMEYYFFYPHVRPGGILVIDDIHIPTVHNMYEILQDDDMWKHVEDIGYTAFFERTSAPVLNPLGDDWPLQRFNRRRFAYPEALDHLFEPGWKEKEFGTAGSGAETQHGAAVLRAKLEAAERELREMRASRSWRWTTPLRTVTGMLQRR
jgi:predicted O-methyltransferase YrrM